MLDRNRADRATTAVREPEAGITAPAVVVITDLNVHHVTQPVIHRALNVYCHVPTSSYYFTYFTFSHLADTFIQSDLQIRKYI